MRIAYVTLNKQICYDHVVIKCPYKHLIKWRKWLQKHNWTHIFKSYGSCNDYWVNYSILNRQSKLGWDVVFEVWTRKVLSSTVSKYKHFFFFKCQTSKIFVFIFKAFWLVPCPEFMMHSCKRILREFQHAKSS